MFEKDEKSETGLYILGWCILGALMLLGAFLRVTGWSLLQLLRPCALHALTGLYCPGCGGTRAVRALLAGDFGASFAYHPFVLFAAVLGGWFMVSQTIERISRGHIRIAMHMREIYLWAALGIVIVNCLIKNIALLVFHVDLLAF